MSPCGVTFTTRRNFSTFLTLLFTTYKSRSRFFQVWCTLAGLVSNYSYKFSTLNIITRLTIIRICSSTSFTWSITRWTIYLISNREIVITTGTLIFRNYTISVWISNTAVTLGFVWWTCWTNTSNGTTGLLYFGSYFIINKIC